MVGFELRQTPQPRLPLSSLILIPGLNIAGGIVGGIIGNTVYMNKEAPSYSTGLAVTMALQGCLLLSCLVVWLINVRGNRRAERGEILINGIEGWRWTL